VPDDRAPIRRRRALAAVALVASALGVAVAVLSEQREPPSPPPAPRGAAPPRAAPPAPRRLSLGRLVGQLVVLRFAGPRAPVYVLRALREGRAAGVILFGDNVTGPAQLRALTRRLRGAGGRPIVALDQEGGGVRIVP
jgi:beta-N-acetylhexosaminidase